jgi:3-isopropylmalate/(R)-2-methylmalate dehydratase small subunit
VTNPAVIERVSGRAVSLRGADIDTDRIMPARFLKAVSFEGIERHLFEDDRAAARASGTTHPLDRQGAEGASLLFVNTNFGCGSSREHAPQALYRWGVRAVVAESFAEIFAGNALVIGLVCVTASANVVAELMSAAEQHPEREFIVDLVNQTIHGASQAGASISLPAASRQAWLSGSWDPTSMLLANYADVERVDARLPYLRTTSRNA